MSNVIVSTVFPSPEAQQMRKEIHLNGLSVLNAEDVAFLRLLQHEATRRVNQHQTHLPNLRYAFSRLGRCLDNEESASCADLYACVRPLFFSCSALPSANLPLDAEMAQSWISEILHKLNPPQKRRAEVVPIFPARTPDR